MTAGNPERKAGLEITRTSHFDFDLELSSEPRVVRARCYFRYADREDSLDVVQRDVRRRLILQFFNLWYEGFASTAENSETLETAFGHEEKIR